MKKRNLLAIVGPGILVAATGVGAGDLATGAFTGQQLGVAVLWAILVTVVISALSGIFQTALYHYAAEGEVPSGYFANDALSASFTQRQTRGRGIIG